MKGILQGLTITIYLMNAWLLVQVLLRCLGLGVLFYQSALRVTGEMHSVF